MHRAVGGGRAALDRQRSGMPLSRCCCLPNVRRFERPGASWKNGSASRLTVWSTVPGAAVSATGQLFGGLPALGARTSQRRPTARSSRARSCRRPGARRACTRRERRARERDLVRQVLVGPADQLDLEETDAVAVAVVAGGDAADLDQLALEEAGVEPAAVVRADERARDLVDRDVVLRAAVRRRGVQRQRLLADGADRVDAASPVNLIRVPTIRPSSLKLPALRVTVVVPLKVRSPVNSS